MENLKINSYGNNYCPSFYNNNSKFYRYFIPNYNDNIENMPGVIDNTEYINVESSAIKYCSHYLPMYAVENDGILTDLLTGIQLENIKTMDKVTSVNYFCNYTYEELKNMSTDILYVYFTEDNLVNKEEVAASLLSYFYDNTLIEQYCNKLKKYHIQQGHMLMSVLRNYFKDADKSNEYYKKNADKILSKHLSYKKEN